MEQTEKARVFWNGRSQAVRIPAAYRFQSNEVYVRRNSATGALTLSEQPLVLSLEEVFEQLDAAGAATLAVDRDLQSPDEREWI